ncbi:hypothetical protein QIA30_04985 (plasmid) [Borreliella turdi]|uniref:hypothetical protein n=1 Tax=Borreliella turdi TaxID=57863 RepID=UPI003AF05B9E
MTYNGLIVYESLILYGKNLKETNNVDFYSNVVLAIFIITIPATIFSILLHLAINHMNVDSKIKKFILKCFFHFYCCGHWRLKFLAHGTVLKVFSKNSMVHAFKLLKIKFKIKFHKKRIL